MTHDSLDLLSRLSADGADAAAVFPAVYEELRAVAASFLRRERRSHTLQPTALVHEAYLRVAGSSSTPEDGKQAVRQRFVALAARAMRQILVEHARHRGRHKRGGGLQRLSLQDALPVLDADDTVTLDLDAALQDLETRSPRIARVAELRLFGGLTFDEIAAVTEASATSVKRDWKLAQLILTQALRGKNADASP